MGTAQKISNTCSYLLCKQVVECGLAGLKKFWYRKLLKVQALLNATLRWDYPWNGTTAKNMCVRHICHNWHMCRQARLVSEEVI